MAPLQACTRGAGTVATVLAKILAVKQLSGGGGGGGKEGAGRGYLPSRAKH